MSRSRDSSLKDDVTAAQGIFEEICRWVLVRSRAAPQVSHKTGAVVYLSASHIKAYGHVIERSPENEARFKLAATVLKMAVAKKMSFPLEQVDAPMMQTCGTSLILSGETEQLPMMGRMAAEAGLGKLAIPIDCGARGEGNTLTQFTTMMAHPVVRHSNNIAFVTSAYHAARVMRTALAVLDDDASFSVFGVAPTDFNPPNMLSLMLGEVDRIMRYAAKGDIPLSLLT